MERIDIAAATREDKIKLLDQIADEGPWDFQPDLVQLARDPDPQVRERALAAFWDLADPAHSELLIDIAQHDVATAVRAAATAALGRYVYEGFVMEELDEADYSRVKEFLLELYGGDSQPLEVRCAALESLGFITEEDIEELIRAAHNNSDTAMRLSAVFAMGRSGTRTWDDILTAEMMSQDPRMRFEAVRAAGETFMSRAAETLETLTEDPDREVRFAAIEALGKAGRPHSRAVLRRLASSRDEDIRDAAATALDELQMFESEELPSGDMSDEQP